MGKRDEEHMVMNTQGKHSTEAAQERCWRPDAYGDGCGLFFS